LFLTIVIPFVVISICNTLIVIKLTGRSAKFARSSTTLDTQKLESSVILTLNTSTRGKLKHRVNSNIQIVFRNSKQETPQERIQMNNLGPYTNDLSLSTTSKVSPINVNHASKCYTRTTKILLLISTSFLFLNFPIAIFKSYMLIKHHPFSKNTTSLFLNRSPDFGNQSLLGLNSTIQVDNELTFNIDNITSASYEIKSTVESFAEIVSDDLYYLNFFFNFFFYSFSGTKFRNALFSLLSQRANSKARVEIKSDYFISRQKNRL